MAKEITLPKLSEDVDEGTVAEVMIKEGDTIEEEEAIIAVESDKATVEVPSPEAGTVKEIKVSEGDAIKTGDVILVLEDEEEDKEDKEKGKEDEEKEKKEVTAGEKGREQEKKKETARQEDQEKKSKKEETEQAEAQEEAEADEAGEETGKGREKEADPETPESEESEREEKDQPDPEEIPAAPGAKRLARERGVDLKDIEGSGPDGLITKKDVKKATGSSKAAGAAGLELPDFSQWGPVERRPLSEVRKATAEKTQSSWQAIPHVTQFDEADVTNIQKYIEEHQEQAEEREAKLTLTAVLTKVIANALHQFPKFNASLDAERGEVILKKYLHIGIAVDTDDGLLVPVVRDVDTKSILELAVEITRLADQARQRELSGEAMQGGNFIISNLGGIGGTQFTPVIYHPQVAILGVSQVKTKPVYKEDHFHPVPVLPLSLSYDHRLIDGAEGARFLKYVCDALEDPYKALLGE